MDAVDADVSCIAEGLHFNNRLAAPNVWEIDVSKDVIDIATDIFERGEPFASASKDGEPYESIETGVGSFFLQRINWQSDACWISVDDKESYEAFHSIFTQLKLPERLAPLFPHSDGIQLYSAFYVVRSQCSAHNFHVDYKPEVGVDAMTLITPLQDYEETDTFQLSYIGHEDGMYASEFQPLNARFHVSSLLSTFFACRLRKDGLLDEGDPGSTLRRYKYSKGKAIIFGSKFMHSTEPGAGKNGAPHAYLCFTFGTTDSRAWPQVSV